MPKLIASYWKFRELRSSSLFSMWRVENHPGLTFSRLSFKCNIKSKSNKIIKIKQKKLCFDLGGNLIRNIYRMFPGFIVPFITQNKSILNVKVSDLLEQSCVTNPGNVKAEGNWKKLLRCHCGFECSCPIS